MSQPKSFSHEEIENIVGETVEQILEKYFEDFSIQKECTTNYNAPKPADYPKELPEPDGPLKLISYKILSQRLENPKPEINGQWNIYIGHTKSVNKNIIVFYKALFSIQHNSDITYLNLKYGDRKFLYIDYEGRKLKDVIDKIIFNVVQWLEQINSKQKLTFTLLTV